MAYDLVIKNGTVIDGTGAFRRRADVAVQDGKVAEIGKSNRRRQGNDRRVRSDRLARLRRSAYSLRCADLLGSTGQLHFVARRHDCRDGKLRSRYRSVQARGAEVAAWDLVNVEAIPFDALSKGIRWEWETFPEFIAAAERRGAGINLAFLAPLTPFRHYVMGDESMEREATPDETARIAGLLREAVDAGAFGFSTTTLPQHIGYQGRPLACRLASSDELKAYANVLRDAGRGAIEVALTRRIGTNVGGRAGAARISARREHAACHVARDGESSRQARGQRRHSPAARAVDQARRRAAGAVQAVRGADGFAQSVLVRRHGAVGAGVQSAARKAEGSSIATRPFAARFARNSSGRICSRANGIESRCSRSRIPR